jgi:transposase-like protein
MATLSVLCPYCQSTEVIKAGKKPNGAQRYRCMNPACERTIFQRVYDDKGRQPEVKAQIVEMALNGSGVRDTARVLGISPGTVISELKKKRYAPARQYIGTSGDQRGRGRCAQS